MSLRFTFVPRTLENETGFHAIVGATHTTIQSWDEHDRSEQPLQHGKKDEQVAWEVKPAQDVFHIQFGDTRMIVNQMHLEEDQMQVPEDMSDDALLLFKNNALLRDWTTKMAITKASVTIEVTPNIVRWVSRSDAWGTINKNPASMKT